MLEQKLLARDAVTQVLHPHFIPFLVSLFAVKLHVSA